MWRAVKIFLPKKRWRETAFILALRLIEVLDLPLKHVENAAGRFAVLELGSKWVGEDHEGLGELKNKASERSEKFKMDECRFDK